ncbi:hypothetical protein IFR04_015011 [Cadophora malorum]|uniref:Alpha/beta hydrolase fold-3 domain-containing protein n=1 Tax=Cadophora malorum TaxID=108018 RepID=A0A8H7T3T5_9HELO|nr:hypothetical protein IFR04_015011 [Cadophora malorum]
MGLGIWCYFILCCPTGVEAPARCDFGTDEVLSFAPSHLLIPYIFLSASKTDNILFWLRLSAVMDAFFDQTVVQQTAATLLRLAVRAVAGLPKPHSDDVILISLRDPERTIKIHIYRPAGATLPSPTLINLHGSGFMLPRHGFSAGANLAMVAASTRFPGIFQSMVVFYPVTDLSIEVSERQYGPDRNVKPAVSPFLLRIFFKSYIQSSPISKKDARLSPTYAPLENFPGRNLFITAAHDNLCQEAEALAARLADLDTKKGECMRVEHCNHAFDKEPAVGSIQERMMKQAYSRVVQFLKE